MPLSHKQKEYLQSLGNRVSLEKHERMLYGHDIAAIPKMVKPIVGNTTPDAVVQPENEKELVDVVRWAYDENIPLTPRAKGSSGYGGIIPMKKGLVIDFYRMKDVVAINLLQRYSFILKVYNCLIEVNKP